MKFSTIFTAAFVAVASASPVEERTKKLCTGLYGNAQCCATDVLGVADLNCGNREKPILSISF